MIQLHDTLLREKRPFVPQNPQRITMYVCGPTVYGRAHIGNARPAVVFDTLARLIRHQFGAHSLVYARNVTDVDDKIIAAAEAVNVGYRRITELYYKHYMDDMGALNVQRPDFEPRATAFVPRMITMIEQLIAGNHAYEAEGHVLFHVPSDPDYGVLSRRDRESILSGARVEVAPYKKDPSDFVLWKPAGVSAEQVALSFESPWGRGRPGWHIECSAMIEAFGNSRGVGETIDIHGGGLDLIFPHHENEIAQSRCAHGGLPLARYWVHNGFVDMGSEKMSKSLGNVITPAELLKHHDGETLRLALLSAHYRKPLPWTAELVRKQKQRLDRLYRRVGNAEATVPDSDFVASLSDDLNTPRALSRLNTLTDPGVIKASGNLMGLLYKTRDEWERRIVTAVGAAAGTSYASAVGQGIVAEQLDEKAASSDSMAAELVRGEQYILSRIAARAEAKARRDFAEADRIRAELKAEGVLLEDGPQGTTWRRA